MSSPSTPQDSPEGSQARTSATAKRPVMLRRRLRRLAVIVVCTYVSVCAVVFLFQARLIYFPSRTVEFTPRDVGLEYEELRLTAGDGVRIAGWHVPCEPRGGTVLFFHGNAGDLGDVLLDVREWHRLGYAVVAIDYRGFGLSEGSPSEAGTYHDAQAAWEYVTQELAEEPSRIIYHGRSLGGGVAVELALRHPPAALIVESTFTSLPDVGREHYPLLPVRWLTRHRYDSASKVGGLSCPKLFLHGSADTLIPLSIGRRLFDAAAPPKQFIATGGDHSDGGMLYDAQVTAHVAEWLRETLHSSTPVSAAERGSP